MREMKSDGMRNSIDVCLFICRRSGPQLRTLVVSCFPSEQIRLRDLFTNTRRKSCKQFLRTRKSAYEEHSAVGPDKPSQGHWLSLRLMKASK